MATKNDIGEFKFMFSQHLICNRLVDNMNKASLVIKQNILKLNCPFILNATTFVLLISHAILCIAQPTGTRDWVSLDTHHRL
jgi:hypothetical protein